ncbi:MAG: acyltransferase [Saprospiraceae bacterium]
MRKLQNIPKRLSRITSSGRFIPEVDGFRFVAILPVVIQHISERLYRYSTIKWSQPVSTDPVAFVASRGTVGVFIFFAISGFILSLPFARHYLHDSPKVSLKSYFWRRITRLEPPYFIWMILFFGVLLLQGSFGFMELLPHLGASLLYAHNIIYQDYAVVNPVAWSLEIEIQFYLLAPILAFLFFSIKPKLIRRMVILGTLYLLILVQHQLGWYDTILKLTILCQLQHFLVGFFLVDLYLIEGQSKPRTTHWYFDGLALFALGVLAYSWSEEFGKNIVFSTALLLLFLTGYHARIGLVFLRNPWITAIGGMCYTIYLIHLPLIEGLIRITKYFEFTNIFGVNLLLQIIIMTPLILLISTIGFLLIEKPCMDKHWPKKMTAWWTNIRRNSLILKKVEP